jgi:hypothetical protein
MEPQSSASVEWFTPTGLVGMPKNVAHGSGHAAMKAVVVNRRNDENKTYYNPDKKHPSRLFA